ncbi:Peptide deformylase [Candidatus Sulfopaludibacter sp. SbA3]|nr:Peptide deformylase [Candidatus Sulfopaludibacter sp. SbA3]
MLLKIVQIGHPVLRGAARPLTRDQIRSPEIQGLIEWMRETMYDAPGVGLAAPQVGLGLQLAVIEDRADLLESMPPEHLAERNRKPVPFQVLINPRIETAGDSVEFFEGCLSVSGFAALVPRFTEARVDCLDHRGEPISFHAEGWHARIVQHEVDHLFGTVYIDRMHTRSLATTAHLSRYWGDLPTAELKKRLAIE